MVTAFLKKAIPGLFFFIFVFSIYTISRNNFANVGIQTADLRWLKLPLYQLSYNHDPMVKTLTFIVERMFEELQEF